MPSCCKQLSQTLSTFLKLIFPADITTSPDLCAVLQENCHLDMPLAYTNIPVISVFHFNSSSYQRLFFKAAVLGTASEASKYFLVLSLLCIPGITVIYAHCHWFKSLLHKDAAGSNVALPTYSWLRQMFPSQWFSLNVQSNSKSSAIW